MKAIVTQMSDGGASFLIQRVERLADGLRAASAFLVASCVIGLGGSAGVACHFVLTLARPMSGPEAWEPIAAGLFGALIGLGISLPFLILFRLQARLAELDVRAEAHAREAAERAEQTARSIGEIAEAGLTGEWRISGMDVAQNLKTLDDG